MAIVFIPPQLQQFTGATQVEIEGGTVREVIERMEQAFPGIRQRLYVDGQLAPELQLSIDHVMTRALSARVDAATEVHFLPAIGGG